MIQAKIPRMDRMNSRIARAYIAEGYTKFKMTLSMDNISRVYKIFMLFREYWPRKKVIEVTFKGGHIYFDHGKIGFHLDDINHYAFKRLCKIADKLKIDLDNFDVSGILKKRKGQLKNTKSAIEELINEIIRETT